MAEKAATDETVTYTELTPDQWKAGREFLRGGDISYEFNDDDPTWLKLIMSPTTEQVSAFEAAIS